MPVSPEKLPDLVRQGPRHWIALAAFVVLIVALGAYQWSSVHSRRRQEMVLSSLSFSHGLTIGQTFEGKDGLIAYLAELGYEYEREAEKGHFEFRDTSETLLLRVKEHESRISAVYLFVLDGHQAEAPGRDLLGLTRNEMHALLGRPGRQEILSGGAPSRGGVRGPPRTMEAWYYLAKGFDLTVGFERSGRTVEVVLQAPITR